MGHFYGEQPQAVGQGIEKKFGHVIISLIKGFRSDVGQRRALFAAIVGIDQVAATPLFAAEVAQDQQVDEKQQHQGQG